MFEEILKRLKRGEERICIIGLGYVGLPLALEFAKKFKVIGFDIKEKRINELKNNYDSTGEISEEELKSVSGNIIYTNEERYIQESRVIIAAVPTPIDSHKNPDLSLVIKASELIGKNIGKKLPVFISFESTVYPGVTEEVCEPIISKNSNLKWKKDFYLGYSPERINPGDKIHTLPNIVKVVSGDTLETLNFFSDLYGEIIKVGVYKASSIKVAEAAKVIENTQRDLNIALINELAIIFHKIGIDTKEVLEAASTKWNFLKFMPGLVGGHCIGVDPYYLTYKAEELGYHPQVILAGRRINDYMGKYIAEETVKLLIKGEHQVKGSNVGVFGITFKENVSDIRNSKVVDIINELRDYGINVFVTDPIADKREVEKEYNLKLLDIEDFKNLDGIIVAVAHNQYLNFTQKDFDKYFISEGKKIIVDVKSIYKKEDFDESYIYWRL